MPAERLGIGGVSLIRRLAGYDDILDTPEGGTVSGRPLVSTAVPLSHCESCAKGGSERLANPPTQESSETTREETWIEMQKALETGVPPQQLQKETQVLRRRKYIFP